MNPLLEILEMLAPPLAMLLVATWTVLCVLVGFRMGREVALPLEERAPKKHKKGQGSVNIDKLGADPWEEAMSNEPPDRITGDMK